MKGAQALPKDRLKVIHAQTCTQRDGKWKWRAWRREAVKHEAVWSKKKKKKREVVHFGHEDSCVESTMCCQRPPGLVDWSWGSEGKRISLSGQVSEGEVWDGDMDWGKGKMERAIGT